MKIIYEFLFENLYTAYHGTSIQKSISLMKLALVPAAGVGLMEFFTNWYIENSIYMTLAILSIMFDWAGGVWVHYFVKKDWSWKKNLQGIFTKTMASFMAYIMFEMVHQVIKEVEFVSFGFRLFLQLVVLIYIQGSFWLNISIITNGKIPPKHWIEKITNFQKDGNINHFKTQKEDEKNN